MPLAFTKNMGQWDDRILFRANSGGATMWFTKEGVTYQFTRRIKRSGVVSVPGLANAVRPYDPADRFSQEKDSVEQLVLTAKFVDANPNPEIVGEGLMEYKCNYFIGNDPAKWHTDVPNYEAITLNDIYPGIDLKYSGDGLPQAGQAAYEFIVAPGANIAQVKVVYEGAEETSLDTDGRLILKTKWGDMIAAIRSPTSDALSGSCAWWTSSSTTSSSDLAHGDVPQAQAGNSGTLELSYSTYLGGSGNDYGYGIAVDSSGNAYVTGMTGGAHDFPTLNPFQPYPGHFSDAFVTKLSSAGSLIYSTYLGGGDAEGGSDWASAISVDGSGNAYVTGYTTSYNFPTLNPFQPYPGGSSDAFVTKLSSSGNSLIYSTYLGGGGSDAGSGIAVDGSGYAYVTGRTESIDFPTLNPYQATYQGRGYYYGGDAFVTKLSSSGNSLIYSTYLGSESSDVGTGIAVDDSGNAYVTGLTQSSDFPTRNPYQATFQGGYGDAFVTKLSSSGNSLFYSTYLGGSGTDAGNGIAVDDDGNAYVTGRTSSANFPTQNPYQSTYQGGWDVFVTKLSNSGNSLIYSTYVGGEGSEYGQRIVIDGSGNVYVTGWTNSSAFPTLNPFESTFQGGYGDAFVTKLSVSGAGLIYSSYLGGGDDDWGYGIAVDGDGNAYVTGWTKSSSFPNQNPFQTYQGGWGDAFVTKLIWTPNNYLCGDVNTDEQVNLLDAVFLINYIFVGGPAPQLVSLADVNCSGSVNIADVVLLINYIFRDGPAPCAGL